MPLNIQGGSRPKQSGMITRHFEHPNGQRATLEIPQGWSNACYYSVATYDADGNLMTGDGTGTHWFETPAEARAAAAQRERDALTGGWRPRIGPMIPYAQSEDGHKYPEEASLFYQNGERINCEIIKLDMSEAVSRGDILTFEEAESRIYDAHGRRAIKIIIEPLTGGVAIERRNKLELERGTCITSIQVMTEPSRSGNAITILGHVREQRNTDPAVQARMQRETTIAAFVNDTHQWTFTTLWQQISNSDPAEKTLVINEIIKRRSEREAQAIRQEQIAANRQREVSDRLAQERAQSVRQHPLPTHKTNSQDQMRKLSGGKDLGKPKPRKIDLGD